jgi:hypothetical protein
LDASFIFEARQSLALRLGIRSNTRRDVRRKLLLDHDAAATIPINLDVLSAEDLHQHKVVFVFREKAQCLMSSHHFAVGKEDDRYT